MNALEGIKYARDAAERIRDGADGYLQLMEHCDRPEVLPGHFYTTFDGSVVFVIRKHTKCTCPACTGRNGILGILFGQPAQPASATHEDQEAPVEYQVVVLRGGHGLTNLSGEKPGEIYLVDPSGFAVVSSSPPDPKVSMISNGNLGMAAMSLQRQIIPKFEATASTAGGER